MAETKKRGPGRPPGSKNKKTTAAEKERLAAENAAKKQRIQEMQEKRDSRRKLVDEIWGIVLLALGVFLIFTTQFNTTGSFGKSLHNVLKGLFGGMATLLPYFLIVIALALFFQRMQHLNIRTCCFTALIYFMICTLNAYRFVDTAELSFGFGDILLYYRDGVEGKSAGAIGMELANILVQFIGKPGLIILAVALMVISLLLVINTPISHQLTRFHKNREEKRLMKELERAEMEKAAQEAVASMGGADPLASRQDEETEMRPSDARQMEDRVKYTSGMEKKKPGFFSRVFGSKDEAEEIPAANTSASADMRPSPATLEVPAAARESKTPVGILPLDKNASRSDRIVEDAVSRSSTNTLSADPASSPGAFTGADRAEAGDGTDDVQTVSPKSYGLDGDSPAHEGYGLGDYSSRSYAQGNVGGRGLDGTDASGRGLSPGQSSAEASFPAGADDESEATEASSVSGSAARKAAAMFGAGAAAASTVTGAHSRGNKENEPTQADHDEIAREVEAGSARREEAYVFPPIDLLKRPRSRQAMMTEAQVQQRADLLETTLQNFHVDAKVLRVTQGASVTRYEVQPATGVKVNKITALADDIALNMRARSIRIEAPIPGKAAVGIEIENDKSSPVLIREIIDSEAFRSASSKISFIVGRDISGSNIVADLHSMPHLLIAGATGSGKSVCINAIITSILYKATPDEVKLVLIDPKVVELGNYNGIPHMLIPVVTDPKKAAAALNWAVNEMTQRYKKFAEEGVKDLDSYNELMQANQEPDKTLPQVVIIIDELADLMMAAPSQVEESICRLAQMARAAGMHLIVATQRPSVDVVTGVIKANIPSRIAFSVSSQFDSRTILDMAGAEKLLGKGDMLFSPVGSPKPIRIQGPFISESETAKVISFVKKQGASEYREDIMESIETSNKTGKSDVAGDELTEDAIAFILKQKQASVSMLQRRFRIGYNRAARIIDEIEERGIIGPSDGSRPRQVLVTEDAYYGQTQGGEQAPAKQEETAADDPAVQAEAAAKEIPEEEMLDGNSGKAETEADE